ncbi:hypothetical protein [Mycobacterium simulans]|uniref:hypothetical protein n=1 Tax=Mycobacterium simulans TaxID=627089 RepID=UPI001CD339E8|nr:hypothetical protein [Mycobacterium simulans]
MTHGNANTPPPPPAISAAPGRRHSTGAVVGAGVVGLVVGAIVAFVISGLTLKVRVELPPPPYPQLSSTPPVSYPPPPAPPSPPSPPR